MESKKCTSCSKLSPVRASYCRCCGSRFPEHTKPGKGGMCHIDSFIARKQAGSQFILEWKVANAEKVLLDGVDVTGKVSQEIKVDRFKKVSLRIENEISFDVEQIEIYYAEVTEYKYITVYKQKGGAWRFLSITLIVILLILLLLSIRYIVYINYWI